MYSAVIVHVMYVNITATYHIGINMSTISNIRLKVLLWGDNKTNINKSSAATRTHGFWPFFALA